MSKPCLMKWPRVAVLACLIAGCAGTSPRERPTTFPPGDHRIVPGERIHNIPLGATAADLIAHLGPPDVTTASHNDEAEPSGAWLTWHSLGLTAYVRYNSTAFAGEGVTEISTSAPQYRTASGVGVGSNEALLRSSLGRPTKVTCFRGTCKSSRYCYDNGLFMHVEDGSVTRIEVGVWTKCT